jgi:arginase family enzyme
MDKKIIFFGCPFDCDEKDESIMEKRSGMGMQAANDDPLDAVMDILRRELPAELWDEKGSVPVPGWLRPQPVEEYQSKMVVDDFVAFIDKDGCRHMAGQVERFVQENVLPHVPCMVTVDHCLTGGVIKALTAHYGKEDITVLILDSHTDAIPMSSLAGAIQYDIDTNPNSPHSKDDPFLYNRPESYNASSFVHHLVAESVVDPSNLMIIGISDYPGKRVRRIKDPRVAAYVGEFDELKKMGAKLITKKDCQLKPAKVKALLRQIRTPYVYLSVDMDIGSRNAVEAVRFRDWKGLNSKQIFSLANTIASQLSEERRLVGMDITEIDPRKAGQHFPSGQDRTYEMAAQLIQKVAFHAN